MKKILATALAAMSLVACLQEEVVTVPQTDAITFEGAYVNVATRAAVDPSTTTASIAGFDVWAFMNEWDGTVLTDEDITRTSSGWTYANTQYWTPNNQYYFAALAPMNSANVTETLAISNETAKLGLGEIAFTNVDGSEDLLYAATTVTAPDYDQLKLNNMPPVKFEFSHLLSKVKFTFTNGFKTDNAYVEIEDIKMTAPKSGTIDLAVANWWDNDDWALGTESFELKFGNVAKLAMGTNDECAQERLTIPAEATQVYDITFTVKLYMGNQLALETVKTSTVTGVAFEMGKAYNLTAEINPDNLELPSIEFDVIVKEWDEAGDVEVGTHVSTIDQLEAALLQGGVIVLDEDLEATSLKASKDAVLSLNGHTITGADNLTGSYSLIEVQPGVSFTVKGSGTLTAKATNNRGWNSYSSVLSNQRGTLVVNEGVVIEHLGGTDMAYGIDNLTNTGAEPAVTIVNGATVKSPYRAIRQFLNSTKANNELQVKARSVIEGSNKSIWSQNANANANPGKTFVEAGAQLMGDVMLSASNASEWPVEVSIAASALVNGAAVVPSNVPAGYAVVLVDGAYTVVEGVTGVADDAALDAALTADAEEINVILYTDVTYDVAAWENDAMGGASTKVITIDLNGNTLTFNHTDSDWNNIVTKAGKLVIKNGKITNSGYNNGPWNRHDLNFACAVELVDVTSDKAFAFKSDATLTNVTIADANTSDTYAIWVQPKGQTIILDGCTIDMIACTDGRGLKIDNEYLSAAEEGLVTLKVSNTVFKTEEKSAILVNSTAGANITLNNVNIAEVAADSDFVVWVDEGASAYADKVVVNGGLCRLESSEKVADGVLLNAAGEYEILSVNGLFWFANEVNVVKNAFDGKTVKLTANIDLANAAWTPVGQTGATTFNGVFDGQNYTISNLNVNSEAQTGANYSSGLFGFIESHTAGRGHIKNVKIVGATVIGHHNCGALVGYITEKTALVENCHVTGATITCTMANSEANGDKAGALIGNATVATPVKDCTAANSTVSAGRDAGQVIGAGKEAIITGCSATNVTVSANGTSTGANVRNEVIGRLLN